MSSRKMSLSGWRPTLVTSPSRTNLEPAFGPRFTTSIPRPSGISSRATLTSAVLGSACDSRGTKVMVVALSSSPASRAAPHDRQKFDPSGLRWPHWLQNTPRGYPAKGQAQVERYLVLLGDEFPVGVSRQQRVVVSGVGGLDDTDPS